MNKKLAAALSGGAVLVLALSGCSDDSSDKMNDWAKSLCGDIGPQLKKINKANQQITAVAADGKPADIQKADSAAFQDLSEADAAIAADLKKAGPPPGDDGKKIQQDAITELTANSKAYADLKKQVDALNVKDQQKFSEGLKSVGDNMKKINETAYKRLFSGDTGKALLSQDACKVATVSPSPTVTPSKT
ncbi:small secreted protein [Streptomyces sp. NPDC051320]|uniref:small secreted protein n=1 Tax=Streptomyces sp. NPDC051320 TaxID=3154644 RepID=UPI0034430B3D